MKKILIGFLLIFLIVDIILVLVLFLPKYFIRNAKQDRQTHPSPSFLDKRPCEDLVLNGEETNCYILGSSTQTGADLLFLLAKVEEMRVENNEVYFRSFFPYLKKTTVFRLNANLLGNNDLFPLCHLKENNMNSLEKCQLTKIDEVRNQVLQDKTVIFEFKSNIPDENNPYYQKCPSITKELIKAFLNSDMQKLQRIQDGPCYPIVSQIYYH